MQRSMLVGAVHGADVSNPDSRRVGRDLHAAAWRIRAADELAQLHDALEDFELPVTGGAAPGYVPGSANDWFNLATVHAQNGQLAAAQTVLEQ